MIIFTCPLFTGGVGGIGNSENPLRSDWSMAKASSILEGALVGSVRVELGRQAYGDRCCLCCCCGLEIVDGKQSIKKIGKLKAFERNSIVPPCKDRGWVQGTVRGEREHVSWNCVRRL